MPAAPWFPGGRPPASLASIQAPASVVLAGHGLGTRPSIARDDVTSGCTGNEESEAGAPP